MMFHVNMNIMITIHMKSINCSLCLLFYILKNITLNESDVMSPDMIFAIVKWG